jgi:uncharacterized protein YndB with AHSA1/START domain
MSLSPEHGLVITRTFDAPRALVWKAWTEPEHLVHWWGQPKNATMPYCTVDLRVGGLFHCCVKTPDGGTIWVRSIFREIVEAERLIFDMVFSDAHGNIVDSPPGLAGYSLITATFAEHDGRTTVTIVHAGVEQASTANQTNYQLGWGESLDRLAERLAAI